MGQITSSVGLVSGIDTGAIVNELISLDSGPVTLLQNRVSVANAQTQAYQLLGRQVSSLQQIGQSLELPTTFAAATATSSAPTVLSASASVGAAVGTYDFNVASLVTSQQAISNGYASPNSLVGAGTLTISQGGGEASSQTTLEQLNGGAGVTRGQFRITDGSGNSAVIDTSNDVTLDDVVNSINSSLNVSVRASIDNDHLVLTDTSGQDKTNFSVADLGSGTTAAQLGIVGSVPGSTAPGGATITGTNINAISDATPLSELNDGRGVGTASGAADFDVNLSNGSTVAVSLGGVQTVGDVIAAINKAGGSNFNATLDPADNGIKINDTSGGSGTFSVTALSGSTAANDLGLLGSTSGTTLGGNTLIASIDSVLVSSLDGGKGIPLGTIHIANGADSGDVDLSGAKSVQDIINSINSANLNVTASLNNAGDGIQLTNTSTSGANLVVSDTNSTTAAALGIAGTFNSSQTVISGGDLHTQYVSANTLLSNYNGGKGVSPGSFTVTNSKGVAATINLATGTFNTIGDVIGAINAKQIGVTASINSNGDGILLTDSAGGPSKLSVTEDGGTTASDLNIAGTATGTTIDGSLTKTIAVSATDTLTTLQQKISALGFAAGATIVNDGSGNDGYHLAITALNSGRAGRIVIDGGATSLTTQNVVNAQDAAVFYGGTNSTNSLLVTSSSNQLTGIIPGVTVQLQGTGQASLNVALDPSSISSQLQTFTTTFNSLVGEIGTLTQWNSTTNQAGLLLGDGTVQDLQSQLYTAFNSVVSGGQYKLLSDVGLTVNGDGTISFNQDTFNAAYAANPTAVQNLFTQTGTGIGTIIDKSLGEAADPVTGSLALQETTLANQVTGFNSQITQLNALLDDQRNTLEAQFANMEVVLAGLQSQGAALSSIGTIGATAAKSSSSSSSGSSSSSSGSSGSSSGS